VALSLIDVSFGPKRRNRQGGKKVRSAARSWSKGEGEACWKKSLMSNLFSLFCLDKFPVRTLAANR